MKIIQKLKAMVVNNDIYQKEVEAEDNNALTVTQEAVDQIVADSVLEVAYFRSRLTIVVAILPCGFIITGESAVVDPKRFDRELGKQNAIKRIKAKLWEHEAYLLANDTYRETVRSYQGGA